MSSTKRLFDVVSSAILLLCLSPICLCVAISVRLTSPGRVLFQSTRVGKRNRLFKMYKFRTMATDAPQVATHLLANPSQHLTPIGGFLRKTSLDELPQLIDVIKGDMSLVGPRPALFNQDDLVSLRTQAGVDALLPGITGWAQVNWRDELPIAAKVDFDAFYLQHHSFLLDLKILGLTVIRVFQRDGVSH